MFPEIRLYGFAGEGEIHSFRLESRAPIEIQKKREEIYFLSRFYTVPPVFLRGHFFVNDPVAEINF